MDNSRPDLPESKPETSAGLKPEPQPAPEIDSEINRRIKQTIDRGKVLIKDGEDYYRKSPRLQKAVYQGKFMPAFWTVACIFSLLVNIILIGLLISFGHHFFALKSLVSDGLVNGASSSLATMDKAHIITTVPVKTTVQVKDELPVVFSLPINQNTQLSLTQDTRIKGAYIYLNNTAVQTDLTIPANTPIQANFNMNVPVSTTVPVNIAVPINLKVPVDIAVSQTDLHQSIVGLQDAIAPYQTALTEGFNSPNEFLVCKNWLTGWLCGLIFGK